MKPLEVAKIETDRSDMPSGLGANGTFGLARRLSNLAAWAVRHDVISPLLHILETCNCFDEHTVYAGTPLGYLRQPGVYRCLQIWEAERPFIQDIRRLIDAYAVSPDVYRLHPPMPREKAAYRQLDGLLGKIPVVALIARPVDFTIQDSGWLEAVRAWCFLQHLDAVYNGRLVGKSLAMVTDKLRMAVDRGSDWQDLITRLKGPTDSLYGLTQHLLAKSSTLLKDRAEKNCMKPAHRQFLAELRSYCSGRDSTISDTPQARGGVFWQYLSTVCKESAPQPWIPVEALDRASLSEPDSRLLGTVNFDPVGDESVITLIEVDDLDPPPVQTRKSHGVILASVEDQQFLRFAWNRPSPPELAELERWIDSTWTEPNSPHRVIALASWLSINTGHSLRTLLTLEISEDLKDEWTLHPGDWSLMRRPPKRYNGWKATTEHQRWIRPRVNSIQILLPAPAKEILASLAERVQGQIETLADLLPDAERIEGRFNEIAKKTPGLERLLSGMLKHQLAQRAFDQSHDATLAQLLASHPRSGLPGSCAYAAFSAAEAKRTLPGSVRVNATGNIGPDEDINAVGSELDPIDHLLAAAFQTARDRIQNLGSDSDKWIEHHNALVSYCVAALLAATGARPVTSPFESLSQFDFEKRLVFLDDKHTNAQHQGRVVPLTAAVSDLIRDVYQPHLRRLADILDHQRHYLSQQVQRLTQSAERQEMPLFFFLTSVPELGWLEVSESSLDATEVFDWPLPWNMMRHRLSTRLRRLGAPQEIVDGILGHSEQGTAAYGFFSSRHFGDDVQQVRPLLESLYRELAIEMPKQPAWRIELADPVVVEINKETSERSTFYGSQGRRARRQHDHAQARRAAIFEIEGFVNKRPLAAVSRNEWDVLCQSMLIQRNGMPHPQGGLRYQTLQDWIHERWSDHASRPNLKRRYLPVLEEPSPYNELSIGATSVADRVRQALELLKEIHISRLSLKPARILGCLSLIAEARVTDRLLLKDVSSAKNVRLVDLDGQIYLEHGTGLHQWPEAPVRRFWIPAHTARWLDRSWDTRSNLDLSKPFQNSLLIPLFESVGLDPDQTSPPTLLEHVCKVIAQENALTLPGYVASFLGGHVMSAALHHQDWIRVLKGQAVTFEQACDDTEGIAALAAERAVGDADEDLEVSLEELQENFQFNTSVILRPKPKANVQPIKATASVTFNDAEPGDSQDEQQDEQRLRMANAQRSAHEFFRAIRAAINKHAKKASSPRRDLDSALRSLIEEATDVSPTCRLLGEWTRSLLWRRTNKGLLRLSSVDRYLNALSGCFEVEAYDHNLFDADAEDLTDLYARLLEARRLSRVAGSTSSNGPSDDDQERCSESYRTWKLAANLLRDFHRMCARELSLEDPDWSEFLGAEVPLSISPGILLEKEYLRALEVLVGDATHASFDALAPAFMLLLTYRFGLRGKEAAGLMRSDWVTTEGGPIVVLVRSNRLRALKTSASRRQVPLLFKLTDHEQTIIARFMALWHGISGGDDKVPLFCNPVRPLDTLDDVKMRSDLGRLIKQVSGNQSLSLHHARHTFANQVARLLLNDAGGCWDHVATTPVDEQQAKHVRSLLLSTHEVTRRSSWALARLLGHAHPHTTFRSYLHLIPDISTKLVRSKQRQDDAPVRIVKLSSVRDLNSAVVVADYLERIDLTPVPRPPITMQSLLRFLFLFQQGSSMEAAAASSGLPSGIAQELIHELDRVDQILASRPAINPLLGGRSRLLSHISSTRWKYWIDRAAGISAVINPDEIDRPLETVPPRLPIGPTRQVLLYKSEHFAMLRQVIELWGLTSSDFKVAATRQLHPMVTQWAGDHGFELTSVEHIKVDGTALQIDSVSEGTPPMAVKHRCAVLPGGQPQAKVKSSFELVFLILLGSYDGHDIDDA